MVVITCKLYNNLRNTRKNYTPIIRNAAEDAEELALSVVNLSSDN